MATRRKNETREEFNQRRREHYAEKVKDPDFREKRRGYDRKRAQNPERRRYQRAYSLAYKYGITLEQYEAMAKAQQHLCLVCGVQPPDGSLVTDHCHKQLHVRGLLCNQCNTGLGLFKDNTETLRNAITYLTPDTFECGAGI